MGDRILRCPDCSWEEIDPSKMDAHMREHVRQQRGLYDEILRAQVSEGCKQVLLDGEHFADAVTPEAAQIIADCINFAGLPAERWPNDVNERLVRYFQ